MGSTLLQTVMYDISTSNSYMYTPVFIECLGKRPF